MGLDEQMVVTELAASFMLRTFCKKFYVFKIISKYLVCRNLS